MQTAGDATAISHGSLAARYLRSFKQSPPTRDRQALHA